jgi:hypothetical protein
MSFTMSYVAFTYAVIIILTNILCANCWTDILREECVSDVDTVGLL